MGFANPACAFSLTPHLVRGDGMRQSTIIFGTLVFAFVIYITVRGQLPAYFSLFTGANVPVTGGGASEGKKAQSTFDKVFDKFDEYLNNIGAK